MSPGRIWAMRVFEAYLIQRLLASHTFRRGVQNVYNTFNQLHHGRHGPNLEGMGGTKIDRGDKPTKNFLDHYLDEIKEQLRSQRK